MVPISYRLGIEPPTRPEDKRFELAICLDRIPNRTRNVLLLPLEYWTKGYHDQAQERTAEEGDSPSAASSVSAAERTARAPTARAAAQQQQRRMEQTDRTADPDYARQVTFMKALRSIYGKPKVSFVPTMLVDPDVFYFPEDLLCTDGQCREGSSRRPERDPD